MKKQVTVVLQAADGELGLWGVFEDSEKAEKSITKQFEDIAFISVDEQPELAEDVDAGQDWIAVVVTSNETNCLWGYMIDDTVQ